MINIAGKVKLTPEKCACDYWKQKKRTPEIQGLNCREKAKK